MKRAFIVFFVLFLSTSSFANVYRGKFSTNFSPGVAITSESFILTKFQNDLGLDIEIFPIITKKDSNRFKVIVAVLIKNPDFTVTDKIISLYGIRHMGGNVSYFDSSSSVYFNELFNFYDLAYTPSAPISAENLEKIRQRASNIFLFSKTIYLHDPRNYEVYFNILELGVLPPAPPSYVENGCGLDLKIGEEQISIFEDMDTDRFSYSFIKYSDEPERLSNGNLKCYAIQTRKYIKVRNDVIKVIETVAGFRIDRVYVIYDPETRQIVEESENLYID